VPIIVGSGTYLFEGHRFLAPRGVAGEGRARVGVGGVHVRVLERARQSRQRTLGGGGGGGSGGASGGGPDSRGLHSSTIQLNLSRF